ncbi:MAG: helix-turn-helix domain-containing protein [Thiomicrorhabdus sp.]|nr:helix-turn-helix domain-containing protein [Thiomicrorhabdus sp.]
MAEDVSENTIPLNRLLLTSREAQSLSLEQIASQLNLAPAQLEKLENDTLDPEKLTTFERGYVRNYANFLQIDPAVIDRYFLGFDYGYSDLHAVKKYGCTTQKPLLGRSIVKWLLGLALLGVLVLLVLPNFPSLLS